MTFSQWVLTVAGTALMLAVVVMWVKGVITEKDKPQ